jgi:alpha-amylase
MVYPIEKGVPMKNSIFYFLALAFLGCAVQPAIPSTPPQSIPEFSYSAGPGVSGWWNDTIFYEIYLRAFQDSDGDGMGDLQGLISRLDYLNDGDPNTDSDLGITALWLMPIFESAAQHGYDTIDYRAIDSDYGTMEDFELLISEANKRGIRVILDFVLNHASREHPWFQDAVVNPDSPYRDFFRFQEGNPRGNWRSIDQSLPREVYYARFDKTMPDLNYESQELTDYMHETTRFWLNKGVAGFRLDAIKYLFEEGEQQDHSPRTLSWLKEWRKIYKTADPDAFTVGEVWDTLSNIIPYSKGALDTNFHFPLSTAIYNSIDTGRPYELESTLEQTLLVFPPGQYATFLRNHDQRRLMRDFEGNRAKAKQAASVLLTLPGVPFLYYGEEIGLSQNRKAMQWEEEAEHYGFSSRRPFSNGRQEGGQGVSVSAQAQDPNSILAHYKALISLRLEHSALRTGDLVLLESGNSGVLAYLRIDDEGALVVIHNFLPEAVLKYGISLWGGPWTHGFSPEIVYPQGIETQEYQEARPTQGGLYHWQPVLRLEANSSYVLKINKN